jgi:hypothetical protein
MDDGDAEHQKIERQGRQLGDLSVCVCVCGCLCVCVRRLIAQKNNYHDGCVDRDCMGCVHSQQTDPFVDESTGA